MTAYESLLKQQYDRGFNDALDLRNRAINLTGTEIIEEERKIPKFDAQKDYSAWAVGSPVKDGEQVFKLVKPYNATDYDGTPSTLPDRWSICHTTNPHKAKPFVAIGEYEYGECCSENGETYKCVVDNTASSPSSNANDWERVDMTETV